MYLPHQIQNRNEYLGRNIKHVVLSIPRNVAITEIVKHRIDGEDDVCDGSVPLNVAVSNGIQAGVEGHLAAVVRDAKAINDLFS